MTKFLTRLRGDLSHLKKHTFKPSFLDTLHPICICGFHIQTLNFFILHSSRLTNESQTKNKLALLAKFVMIPLGRINNSSISNRCSHSKETDGLGMATLSISNEEKKDIKIVQPLQQSCKLAASLLGNLIAGKTKKLARGVIRGGKRTIIADHGRIRAGQSF